MPANEFEKQVQQKMDEFQLEPSASVWQKVEEEIRKKKRRRIIFFFILPAAIALLGSSVYFFINDHSNHNVAKQPAIVNEKKTEKATTSNNSDKIEGQLKESNKQPHPNSNETVVSKTNTPTQSNAVVKGNGERTKKAPLAKKPSDKLSNSTISKKNIIRKSKTKVEEEGSLAIDTETPNKKSISKPVVDDESKTEKQITEPVIAKQKNENKNNDPVAVAEQGNVTVSKTDTVAKAEEVKTGEQKEIITKKKTGKPKIKWGIDLSAGLAGTNENIFDLNFQKSLNDALYANPSTGGTSTGSRPGALPPSPTSTGFAFRTGIVAELQVSKRSRFSTGLQYAFLSNKMKAGRKWDSTLYFYNSYSPAQIAGYYGGVRQSTYTNKFHFIQLPVYYHWQINKGKKLPLQWNIGMTPGYLVSNNGLVYDTSYGGVYYSSKKAFNKFHLNIGTGLSARVKGKNGAEWIFGPEVSFDLNRLISNPFDKKQYLFFGGINARLLFPQKKK